MALATFPAFSGLGWDIKKRVLFSNSREISASGAEFTNVRWTLPHFEFDLGWNYLGQVDRDAFEAFYLSTYGGALPFLLSVTNDSAKTGAAVGTGNGSTTAFAPSSLPAQANIVSVASAGITDWQAFPLCAATSRSNMILWSGDPSNAAWTVNLCTRTANAAAAPDGTTTACRLIATAVAGFHYLDTSTYTPADNALLSALVFVKKDVNDYVAVNLIDKPGGGTSVTMQFSTGLVTSSVISGGATYSVTALTGAAAGWFAIRINGMNVGTGATPPRLRVLALSSAGNQSFTGSGTDGVYVWGGQIEPGATAGRYIATTTTSFALTDVTAGATALTFSPAPVSGAAITWTGTYAYVVRFKDDTIEFNQMLHRFYEQKKLTFRTVR